MLLVHGLPEQHGWVASQSPPSGMQAGFGGAQIPPRQSKPLQHGWPELQLAPGAEHVAQVPDRHMSPSQHAIDPSQLAA